MSSDRSIRDQHETHVGLPGPWRQEQLDFLYRISADEKKREAFEEIIENYQWWQGTGQRFKWIALYGGAIITLVTMVVKFFRDQLPHNHP